MFDIFRGSVLDLGVCEAAITATAKRLQINAAHINNAYTVENEECPNLLIIMIFYLKMTDSTDRSRRDLKDEMGVLKTI